MIDLHVHTKFDEDAVGEVEEYCKLAASLGYKELGFIKHTIVIDRFSSTVDPKILESFFSEVERHRERFGVNLRIGAEMDYFEDKEEEIEKLKENFKFDYILCAIHFLHGCVISDPMNYEFKECYRNMSYWEACKEYFLKLKKAVESNLFDGVAHFDYIRRTASIFYKKKLNLNENPEVKGIVEEILEVLRKKNLIVEINTSALRDGFDEFYPNNQILNMCREKGIKITIGSDSHSPKHFNTGIKEALSLLENLGFQKVYSFSAGKLIEV